MGCPGASKLLLPLGTAMVKSGAAAFRAEGITLVLFVALLGLIPLFWSL